MTDVFNKHLKNLKIEPKIDVKQSLYSVSDIVIYGIHVNKTKLEFTDKSVDNANKIKLRLNDIDIKGEFKVHAKVLLSKVSSIVWIGIDNTFGEIDVETQSEWIGEEVKIPFRLVPKNCRFKVSISNFRFPVGSTIGVIGAELKRSFKTDVAPIIERQVEVSVCSLLNDVVGESLNHVIEHF